MGGIAHGAPPRLPPSAARAIIWRPREILEDHPMARDASTIRWLDQPEDHDYEAAKSYLSLTVTAAQATRLASQLRRSRVTSFKAKDIFRASGLSLLGISNMHVEK